MSVKAILFDLDGTLLPMDQDTFARAYIEGLTAAAAPAGYNRKLLAAAIISGTAAMAKNNGSQTNEAVFWDTLESTYGAAVREGASLFDVFYAADFQKIKDVCGFAPQAGALLREIKERGFRTVLATNPLFPRIATESRIRWAGLQPEDFELYTTYETSCYCKPNLKYYEDILGQLQLEAQECVMVGNDVSEDMAA